VIELMRVAAGYRSRLQPSFGLAGPGANPSTGSQEVQLDRRFDLPAAV
jgi:hypothetical protein